MFLYRQAWPAHCAAMPVLHLLSCPKWVFRPTGATHRSDEREIWQGGADRYRDKNVGIQPPKPSKFRILLTHLPPPRGSAFVRICRQV